MFDFTPSEKRALSSLILVIGAAGVFQLIKPMSVRTDPFQYSKEDSIFQRLSSEYFTVIRSDTETATEIRRDGSFSRTIYPVKTKKDGILPEPKPGSIDLNTAPAAVLEKLPRIGPAMAARIVEFRTIHGKFKSFADLQNVKGIGAKTLESIKPYLKPIE